MGEGVQYLDKIAIKQQLTGHSAIGKVARDQ
jgi:acetylglutamate synthase